MRWPRRRADRSARHRESGAIAIMMSLTICFVMLPLAAFTVDIGMQRVLRKDMQAVADTVALDMARTLGSGTAPTNADAAASGALTKGTLGGTPALEVRVGYVGSSATFVSDQTLGCSGRPAYNTYFRQTPPGTSPNAVLVTASSKVKFAFHPGDGGACRSSLATAQVNACFRLGSYAAAVNSGKSSLLAPIVGKLLGGSLDLTALGYQGIATSAVSLADLITIPGLGIGTPDQLLTTPIQLSSFYLAMAQVLTRNGDTANAQIVQTIATHLGPLSGSTIRIGDLIALDQGNQAALTTDLNVLDLVTGGLILANGSSAIDIPGLNATLPLLGTGLTAKLRVLQQPQLACGLVNKAKAKTAQISLDLTGSLVNAPNLLGLLSITVGQVHVTADVAQATGTLTRVQCATRTVPPSPHQLDVSVATALAGNVALEVPVKVKANLLLGIPADLQVLISTKTVAGAETGLAQLKLPPNHTTPVSTGSDVRLTHLGATNITVSSSIPIVGPLLGVVSNLVLAPLVSTLISQSLNPLIDSLNTALLGPLSDLLGLNLAGADVYGVLNDTTPTCGLPQLVG